MSSLSRAVVISTGAYLPTRIMTNHELAEKVDTSHEWIVERTGIEQRHIAAQGELTSDLAIAAAKQALANASIDASSIDMLIVATTTPDLTLPATATKVQSAIGATNAAAFDISAACSGFVYGATLVQSLMASGAAKRILLIGAETYSRIVDWNDRGTCILFGDGAGAVLFEAQTQHGSMDDRGILSCVVGSDGLIEPLRATGGVSLNGHAGVLHMAGKEIYRHAIHRMPESVITCMKNVGLPLESIDWLVPHQANLRILHAVGQKLGISAEKLVATVQKQANTSAATIPLALHEAASDGRLKRGNLIACPALGAGLTWGCALIRW